MAPVSPRSSHQVGAITLGFCETPSGIDSLIRNNRLRPAATAVGFAGGSAKPE